MGEFRDRTEKVGPAGHQTEAGIFEFRRLNTGPLVLHEWRPFATSFYEYIVALHAAPAEHANGDEKPVQLAKDEKTGYVGAATAAGPPAAAAPAQKAQRNDVHAAFDGEPAATLPRAEITGLPDRLKAGVENLSGLSMDDVRVHYNSPQPAAVQALAYTQGTDIHLAPGQQKHLPHEAWHVVQQKQGRVKPTLQMKGVAINDDTGLELEAEAMAGRALQTKPPLDRGKLPLRVPSTGVVNRFGAWVGRAPVQRKVGFEIEVENIGVERGILKEKSREVEEQFLDSEGRPIQDASVLESSPKEPLLEIRSAKDKPIEKGDTIFKGQGWRLTPDGEPKKWYGEFITDPIDETKDSKSISAVLESITDYALAIDGLKSEAYYNKGLANQYIIQRGPQKFSGNFHTTGGIRIDQIVDLLEQARIMLKKIKPDRDEKDEESADVETKKTSPPAAKLVPTKKDASGNYRGLVALVSNYIIAQRGTSRAPGYAKEFLPVMSRTNLGAIRNKVKDMPPFSDFLKDVLAASKTAEDAPLFPKGILEENTEDDEVARPEVKAIHSIGADSGIAVRKWLEGIYGGKDKVVWSDTLNSSGKEFGFEKVGPALSGSCCAWLCTSRAEGAIVEIRNADGGLVPLADWIEVGESFAEIFMRLNS
jgi:hypothetical protein